ncbi:MAG: hypothetical protein HY077_18280 [Elusimicrobia bacterium]|nr:hypothetical protein [Elusimicrobiota bacterium]
MPALLLAGISSAGESSPAKTTSGPALAGMPEILLDGLAKSHGGAVLRSEPDACLISFASTAAALTCALAAQRRFCDYNRDKADDKLALVRLALHWSGSSNGGAPTQREAKMLSLMLDVTPPGRVFVSRPIFTQSHGSQACAFIPLGIEYFSGLEDPLDLLEAVAVAGAVHTLAPVFTGTGPSAPLRATMAPEAAVAPAPSGPQVPVFEALRSPLGLAAAVGASVPLYLLGAGLMLVLSPLELLDYLFHTAGHVLFGLSGSENAAAIGALVLQAGAPLAVFAHYWLRSKALPAQAALFWLGQSLLSIGGHLGAAGGVEVETFAACVKNDGIALARAVGWLARYNSLAHLTAFLGCAAMAAALAEFWVHLRRDAT